MDINYKNRNPSGSATPALGYEDLLFVESMLFEYELFLATFEQHFFYKSHPTLRKI